MRFEQVIEDRQIKEIIGDRDNHAKAKPLCDRWQGNIVV